MKVFRIALIVLLLLVIVALSVLYLTTHEVAVLEPVGMIGKQERDLFFDTSLLMLLVVIPTIVLSLLFAWRYRASNKRAKYTPNWNHSHLAEAIWWGVPFVIIFVLSIMNWKSTHALNPFNPIEGKNKPMTIQVVALEWKWLFLYPEYEIATVNYLQIPINTPIRFEITADAPMNSFWIPKLGGQIYAMPAMRSELHLIADKTATFQGHSANISGTGFAGMNFPVVSSTQEEFNAWVESVRQSPKQLTIEEYKQLVQPSQNHPMSLYNLKQENLFERIIRQYEPEGAL